MCVYIYTYILHIIYLIMYCTFLYAYKYQYCISYTHTVYHIYIYAYCVNMYIYIYISKHQTYLISNTSNYAKSHFSINHPLVKVPRPISMDHFVYLTTIDLVMTWGWFMALGFQCDTHQTTMEHHGTSWNIMEHHGTWGH